MLNLEQKTTRGESHNLGVQVFTSPLLSAKVESGVKSDKKLSSVSLSPRRDVDFPFLNKMGDEGSTSPRSFLVLRGDSNSGSESDDGFPSLEALPPLTRQKASVFYDSFGSSSQPSVPPISEETESPYGPDLVKPNLRFSDTDRHVNHRNPSYRYYLRGFRNIDKPVYNLDGRIVTPYLEFDKSSSSKYAVADLKGGCRLSPEFMDLTVNRKLRGFFSYFLLSDLYPLFHFAVKNDKELFGRYYDQLWLGEHTWRGGDASSAFWSFVLANKPLISSILTLPFVTEKRRLAFLDWRDNYLVKALDFPIVLAPSPKNMGAANSLSETLSLGLVSVRSSVINSRNFKISIALAAFSCSRRIKLASDEFLFAKKRAKKTSYVLIKFEMVRFFSFYNNFCSVALPKVQALQLYYETSTFAPRITFGDLLRERRLSLKKKCFAISIAAISFQVNWRIRHSSHSMLIAKMRAEMPEYVMVKNELNRYFGFFNRFRCGLMPRIELLKLFNQVAETERNFFLCVGEINNLPRYEELPEISGARAAVVEEVEGPFLNAFRSMWIRKLDSFNYRSPAIYTGHKAFASDRLWRIHKDEAAEAVLHFSMLLAERIHTIDTFLVMIKHGERVRALLQFLKLVLASPGLIRIVRALIESVQEFRALGTKWLDPCAESELESESVDAVEGPHEIFDSLLYKKFSLLLSTFLAEPILSKLPNFLQHSIIGVLESVKQITAIGDLYEALKSFSYVFLERCQEFCITWDWRAFLDAGGFSTWIVRANDWVQDAGSRTSKYSTILDLISAGSDLKEEGEKYMSSEFSKNNPGKKWTPDHSTMFRILSTKYTKIRNDKDSAEPRTRIPFTGVFLGPPGTGKTYLCSELLRYILIKKGRPLDANRNPLTTGADMYMVPKDKHWNNCHDPVLIVFNDLLGDGYVNNGSTANMADLLRLAADIEPFYTPQASLEDKLKCVQDPDAVVWTGNTMTYDFSCFGTDWSKLIRRYKKIYYCAFPSECYKKDISEFGDDHGELVDEGQQYQHELRDRMRYYSCKMLHNAGRIRFVREKLIALGVDEFLKIVRADYREALATKGVNPVMSGLDRCCEDHPLSAHTEKCSWDCDWKDPTPRPPQPGIVNPLYEHPLQVQEVQCWPVVDKISDDVSERVASRYEARIKVHFEKLRPYFRGMALAISAGLGMWALYSGVKLTKKQTKVEAENVEGNVINPIKTEFTPAFLDLFSPSEAKAKEGPNPATWASTSRAYATFSKASRSSAFEDVVAKVQSNTIEFFSDDDPDKFGTGVFLSSIHLLVNTHTLNYFKDKMVRVRPKTSTGLRYEFDFSFFVSDGDISVAKVPPYPASNILDHVAEKVGTSFEGKFNGVPVTVVRKGVDFRGKIGLNSSELLCYSANTRSGDCGKPLVAKIEKNGAFVGIHVVKLASGDVGAWPITRSIIDPLIEKLGNRPVGVVMEPIVTEVQGLFEKSKFRSANGVSMVVFGTAERANKQAKSSFYLTPLASTLLPLMENPKTIPTLHIDGVKRDEVWYAPYVHKFKGMSIEMRDARQWELERALADYVKDMPVDRLAPLTLDQVVAGVEGDKLLKKINMNTSSGIYQRFVPDKTYLVDLIDLTITKELRDRIETKANMLRWAILVEHQKWALKDEPVDLLKEYNKKYRYFMISDFDNLLLFRIFVSPLVAHMYRHRAFFEATGSFNPASPQFGDLIKWLKRFSRLVMADIKHMDSSYRAMIAEYVARFFYILAKSCGYNEESAQVVLNLIRSTCFSIVEFSGDWAFFSEGMGSGIYVTFVVNCLILCLLYRVAWFRINSSPFREHNSLATGGDDSVNSTDDERFDGIHIFNVFRDYGYELSPPTDKSGSIVPFYDFDDLVYWKRTPSKVVCKGKVYEVGKLAKDSILKPLIFSSPSAGVSERDRLAQVLDAACREMALHGLEEFVAFKKIIAPFGYVYRELSYDDIINKYVGGDLYEGIDDPFIPSLELVDSVESFYPRVEFSEKLQRKSFSEESLITHATFPLNRVKHLPLYTFGSDHVRDGRWGKAVGGVRVYNSDRYIKINTLSDFIGNDSHNTNGQKTTTFELASGTVSTQQGIHAEADYGLIENPITLSTSLGRPTYLTSFTWTPVTPSITSTSDLYTIWRTDSFVSSKLHGFKFFRGKPKLRFVVNGFVFYYGKLVCSIDLNPGSDTLHPNYDPQINSFSMVNVSQGLTAPNVSIDPSVSATYDLEVPWYATNGWYNMFNVTEAPTLVVKFFPLNALASANDVAPTSVEIKVYLMMDDVELSVPAVAAIQGPLEVIEVEGPKESSPSGTISKPLLAVSSAAGMLKSIPMLAPFAGPIEVAAGIGSKIAAILGYSKPIILEESRPVLNCTVSAPTYFDGRAALTKLTGDPKQEVAISALAASVGSDDDMLLAAITRRPGLVTQMTWSTLGLNDSISIFPNILSDFATGGQTQYIPLSWVSACFKYWSGSIVVRIEIVASGMHRGAIGVSWVPYDDPPGGSVLAYPNKFLTKIIDITETKLVDFVVPFAGDFPNLPINTNNGRLHFYEINALKSSGSTSSVGINIYVMAGDDFQLYRPSVVGLETITYMPVAAVQGPEPEIIEGQHTMEPSDESAPLKVVKDTMPGREKIYFGETVTSIKQLCNRETMTANGLQSVGNQNGPISYTLPPYPILPAEPSFLETNAIPQAFSYAAYFAPAFLAMRGSFRFKVLYNTTVPTSALSYPNPNQFNIRVQTIENPATQWYAPTVVLEPGETSAKCAVMARSAAGSVLENLWFHPALEFEVPYTNPTRFVNPRKQISWYKANLAGLVPNVIANTRSEGGNMRLEVWSCAGDDFSLHGFMYIPQTRVVSFA